VFCLFFFEKLLISLCSSLNKLKIKPGYLEFTVTTVLCMNAPCHYAIIQNHTPNFGTQRQTPVQTNWSEPCVSKLSLCRLRTRFKSNQEKPAPI